MVSGTGCIIQRQESLFWFIRSWFPVLSASSRDKSHFFDIFNHGFRYWMHLAWNEAQKVLYFIMVSGTVYFMT
jgi:hypothetical protein